jgi:hypothetical protein
VSDLRGVRAAIASLLAVQIGTGCADAALHAAAGTPKQWAPLAVSTAQSAWRSSDGSLGVCVDMWIAGGAWHSDPGATGAFSAQLPKPASSEVEIPFDAWQSHVSQG